MSRQARIAAAFGLGAGTYDDAAPIQRAAARRLARRIAAQWPKAPPRRILEIGCGTGFLSAELAALFPESTLVLTDIAPAMLQRCQARLGAGHAYRVMDGAHPDADLTGGFDLVVSSLALQWLPDLRDGLRRLALCLAPGGQLAFATLGQESFAAWRQAHAALGLACGLHAYPEAAAFPWPPGLNGHIAVEWLEEPHASGLAFLRALKRIGAGQPALGHEPLSPAALRRVLARFEDGFTARYQILYGQGFAA